MKTIRIDDKVHEQLKKEASNRGVFLHWLIEHKLTNQDSFTTLSLKPPIVISDTVVVPDDQQWKEVS